MCTSLAAGFYLKDEADFDMWAQHLHQMKAEHGDKFIFTVFEKEPALPRRYADPNNAAAPLAAQADGNEGDDSFEDLDGFQVL